MIKAIIFDFFGVICSDNYWQMVKADRQKDSKYRHLTDNVNLGKMPWDEFIVSTAKSINKSVDEVNDMYAREQLDPRVIHKISELHNTYKTGLITNAHHDYIDSLLEQYSLKDIFDSIVVSSRVGVIKPNPMIFEIAMNELDARPDEIIYIDDLQRHVDSATQIGIKAILYKDFEQFSVELNGLLAHA